MEPNRNIQLTPRSRVPRTSGQQPFLVNHNGVAPNFHFLQQYEYPATMVYTPSSQVLHATPAAPHHQLYQYHPPQPMDAFWQQPTGLDPMLMTHTAPHQHLFQPMPPYGPGISLQQPMASFSQQALELNPPPANPAAPVLTPQQLQAVQFYQAQMQVQALMQAAMLGQGMGMGMFGLQNMPAMQQVAQQQQQQQQQPPAESAMVEENEPNPEVPSSTEAFFEMIGEIDGVGPLVASDIYAAVQDPQGFVQGTFDSVDPHSGLSMEIFFTHKGRFDNGVKAGKRLLPKLRTAVEDIVNSDEAKLMRAENKVIEAQAEVKRLREKVQRSKQVKHLIKVVLPGSLNTATRASDYIKAEFARLLDATLPRAKDEMFGDESNPTEE